MYKENAVQENVSVNLPNKQVVLINVNRQTNLVCLGNVCESPQQRRTK